MTEEDPVLSRTVKLISLPHDADPSFVEAFVGGFVYKVTNLVVLPSEGDATSAHAIISCEANSKELQILQQCVQRGCFGRKDVRLELLDAVSPSVFLYNNNSTTEITFFPDDDDKDPSVKEAPLSEQKGWKDTKELAKKFHAFLFREGNEDLLARASDREVLSKIFEDWLRRDLGVTLRGSKIRYTGASVMAALRRTHLMRSERVKDSVVCSFARTPKAFPPLKERKINRGRVLAKRQQLEESKWGVSVYPEKLNNQALVKTGDTQNLVFTVISSTADEETVTLQDIVMKGGGVKAFQMEKLPSQTQQLEPFQTYEFTVSFRPKGAGIYRITLLFNLKRQSELESIARYITVRGGDALIQEKLKPTAPYQKKKRNLDMPKAEGKPVPPPKSNRPPSAVGTKLSTFRVPLNIFNMARTGEMEPVLEDLKPNDSIQSYGKFWQNLLWTSEVQAKRDMALFDLEEASLLREGNHFSLRVPGLAEGRPSVLRGDTVFVTWNKKRYVGRVEGLRQLEILIKFDKFFHESFHHELDRIHVRFTFSRMTFRTGHLGCLLAPVTMGKVMLFPDAQDIASASAVKPRETVGATLKWGNPGLNEEQKVAVRNILLGSRRPLPYVTFGPPGTGKTTTVAEAVYQLARHQSKMKILLVAPSNDAADLLIEKLSRFFPPSEMRRILAFTRSIDTVSPEWRSYCKECQTDMEFKEEIEATRLVVSTVNLAARFSLFGVSRGHFDVLCVDEAGHATEPEVIAVAATLIDFEKASGPGQLILAGDPKQLGPVIASDVCVKFGMSMSYMERLTLREVYARSGTDAKYPSDLITKLKENYRSHPTIMKLPNEMFYENELLMCGDKVATHSLARWEHLPKEGFPIFFHAVHGENLREENSPSWFNPHEAGEVANYVDLLVNQTRPSVAQDDIGVITPYNRQVQKIRTALELKGITGVKVGSVETFQGQERRVIILSTVRAENDKIESDIKNNLGFVANEKRFNVAVTRAIALLIVVGHPRVLATDKDRWLPLLKLCKENGAWVGQDWDENAEDESDEGDASDDGSAYEDCEGNDFVIVSARAEQEGLGFVNREE